MSTIKYKDPTTSQWTDAVVDVITEEPTLVPLSVTENGTYIPSVGTDGYSSVQVDVPSGSVDIENKSGIIHAWFFNKNGGHQSYAMKMSLSGTCTTTYANSSTATSLITADYTNPSSLFCATYTGRWPYSYIMYNGDLTLTGVRFYDANANYFDGNNNNSFTLLGIRITGDGLQTIPDDFYYNTNTSTYGFYNLTYLELQGVRTIGNNFCRCDYGKTVPSISNLYIPKCETIGDYAFGGYYTIQTKYNIRNDLYLPNIKTIGNNCFQYIQTSKVVLGPNCTSIGNSSLTQFMNSVKIYFYATTPPTLGTDALKFQTTGNEIHVPQGTLAAYQAAPNYPSASSSSVTWVEDL